MKKTIVIVGIVLVLALAAVILTGCGTKGIVGKWAYSSSFVYTFNADKTGNYDALGTIKEFTYEDDGTTLSILFEGNTEPMELQYRIDGDKLIITDSFGEEIEYVKK